MGVKSPILQKRKKTGVPFIYFFVACPILITLFDKKVFFLCLTIRMASDKTDFQVLDIDVLSISTGPLSLLGWDLAFNVPSTADSTRPVGELPSNWARLINCIGVMKSGKSDWAIREAKTWRRKGISVLFVTHALEKVAFGVKTRDGVVHTMVRARTEEWIEARRVERLDSRTLHDVDKYDVVMVNELQFFDTASVSF